MKFKPDRCQSMTRGSNYKVQCKCKGYWCKTSRKYRCKFHAGLSAGPTTKAGLIKSLQNLKNVKQDTINKVIDRKFRNKTNERSDTNFDLPSQRYAKSIDGI